jgi:uncharacterized membrane protein YeaQ/YmgE (transglycosylase-associated protein family)
MHIVAMLVIGLIVGVLAKLISPGPHSHSIIMTIVLGIVGSVVAGSIGHAIGWYRTPGDAPGIIASTIGALLVLGVYHLFTRRQAAEMR